MGKGRRSKTGKNTRAGVERQPPREEPAAPTDDGGGSGGWKTARTWVAGIVSAALIAAVGVVFTDWFTSRGTDAIGRISGAPPVTIGHVAIQYDERDIVLREPVTDPEERGILLGRAAAEKRAALLNRHHGSVTDWMNATVVLVGNRNSLRIVDIKPRVLTRKPRSDGAFLKATTAGEADTVELLADLDRPVPRFTTAEDPDISYFSKKQIDLKRDERITLSVSIKGKKAYYEFDLLATVLADDRTEQIVIKGPDGAPFRLTGEADTFRSVYEEAPPDGWTPVPAARVCVMFPKTKGC
ncbi:hypothetical protein [Streptosporangium amethystogenes]|uniref:hypothetical protein n=1 Tax=Streptosporangium amethystogenes TaxID=2002 RepID=UPI0004CB12E7|nr:hypothetical protein [Streptosporangium amethystogenes]